jgi:drug/metabolite transporter (DMT)-like permease
MVETGELVVSRDQHSPIPYFIKMTAFITCSLTVAGGSWYVAVNLTSASDLTAIYNCSAFFAYVFSVLLLNEKLRLDKSLSVLVAIIGVFVVAYGDSKDDGDVSLPGASLKDVNDESRNRLYGNIVIGVGSVIYGFYEVLYKKFACPPDGTSPGRGMIFANTFGSLMGIFTLLVLWIPFPFLHWTGVELFELPSGEAAWVMLISTLASAIFSGSFLALISLTSPVLSSVAALLSIFIVAIVDWFLTGKPLKQAAIVGGLLITGAFILLSWSTFREMQEERRKCEVDLMESDESERED